MTSVPRSLHSPGHGVNNRRKLGDEGKAAADKHLADIARCREPQIRPLLKELRMRSQEREV